MKPREPWLAVDLSFVLPGLGELYCGRRARGVSIAVGWVVLLVSGALQLLLHATNPIHGMLLLVVAGVVMVVGLFDAHSCARRANSQGFQASHQLSSDAWRALFLSRIFPGRGHIALHQYLSGGVAMVGAIALSTLLPEPVATYVFAVFAALVACNAYRGGSLRNPSPRVLAPVLACYMAAGRAYKIYWPPSRIGPI